MQFSYIFVIILMVAYFNRLLLFILLFILAVPLMGAKRTHNVLYIQSYTENDMWSKDLNAGLIKGFTDSSISVNVTTEYLNSRFWNSVSEEEIMRRICRRATERGTDLIVVSNDEALYSLLVCGDSLPAKVPVVFFNVEYPNRQVMYRYPNVTGITVAHSFIKLLETAKHVFPKRKNVVLITENTRLAQFGATEFMKQWEKFSEGNPDYQLQEFNATISPLTSIVYQTQLSTTISSSIIVIPYWGLYMPSIAKVSKSPTFAVSNSALTQGGFCTVAPNLYNDAYEAAGMAVKVLKGANPSSIDIKESGSEVTFDYKQLQFFGVKKDRVPKDGIIMNEPYMEKYGFYLVLFYTLIVGLLIFLVVRLFVVNRRESRRRMHAQTKLLIQNRLVSQRNEFDNVFHSIRDAVVTYDNDLRIHFVNKATFEMLNLNDTTSHSGARPYEGQQAGAICDFLNDGKSILLDLIRKVYSEGSSQEIPENTYVRGVKNNIHFLVSGEVVPIIAQGKQTGIALTFRNISEQALQKRFFNMAVAESSIFPWQYNAKNDEFTFPSGYISRMGFTSTHVPKAEMDARINPEDLEEAIAGLESIIKGEVPSVRLNFRLRNASSAYEWWEFRVSSIKGMMEGDPHSILGVCQSIQRYKVTEEELIAARDRALQADKLKSAFLANMSHEIRTPLNAIVGFSDLLKDIEMFSAEEVEQFIATINKNCELLLALISDILDLSRVESGTMDFQFSPYYLPIIMQEIYDSQRLNMPEGVVLVKNVPERSEKTVITDSVRLKQVINNLINNAAKFTTSGSITFGYQEDEPDYTTFFVEDTGIGLTEEDQIRIFERFYKVDSFTQGAGLGLSISQTIIARLRGTIGVTSERGKGTRFFVRIPDKIS